MATTRPTPQRLFLSESLNKDLHQTFIISRPKTSCTFQPVLDIEAHNMATLDESDNVSYRYFLRSRPRLNTDVSTNSSSTETSPTNAHVSTASSSPVEASLPKGYEDTSVYQFTGIPDLREHVRSLAHKLAIGHTTN